MPELCPHTGCGFERRLEYCETEAAEREGAAGVVINMLDSLLYESGVVTSDDKLQSNRDSQIFTRTFSYLQGDPKSWVWPLTETEVAICHTKDKHLHRETYQVALSWRVEQIGATEDRFLTTYGIDIYPEGPVQAFIEQGSIVGDTCEVRRITTYDYEKLFDELQVVYDLHAAERNDNARVV